MRVAQAPPQQLVRGKMPELDALRGVAILAVLFYHGFAWSSDPASFPRWQRVAVLATTAGWLGVNLFFVLSGFLITGILLDTRRDLHYYRNFYLRRALRILPLYYVVLAVLLVTGIGSAAYVALSAIYLANLTWIVGVGADYQVLWSLAVEEHFYFLWPALVRWLSAKRTAAMCVGIVVLTPLARMVAAHFGLPVKSITWGELDGLACGAFIAAALRFRAWDRRQFAWLSAGLVVLGTVVLLAGIPFGIITRRTWVGSALQETPFNLVFAGMLSAILLLGTSRWARFAAPSILRFFGDISYCLYLVHLLVFIAFDRLTLHFFHIELNRTFSGLCIRFVISVSCTVAVACISKHLLEEPFLRLKSRLTATKTGDVEEGAAATATT